MKLYAVRDKETGNFLRVVSPLGYISNDEEFLAWHDTALPAVEEEFEDNDYVEIVTLRIEPTKPCPRCTEPVDFYDYGNAFCGDCGRRLTDEAVYDQG